MTPTARRLARTIERVDHKRLQRMRVVHRKALRGTHLLRRQHRTEARPQTHTDEGISRAVRGLMRRRRGYRDEGLKAACVCAHDEVEAAIRRDERGL